MMHHPRNIGSHSEREQPPPACNIGIVYTTRPWVRTYDLRSVMVPRRVQLASVLPVMLPVLLWPFAVLRYESLFRPSLLRVYFIDIGCHLMPEFLLGLVLIWLRQRKESPIAVGVISPLNDGV